MARQPWRLVRPSVVAWSEDYASSMGAALAFYAMAALAPIVLVALAGLSLALPDEAAQRALAAQAWPDAAETLAAVLWQAHSSASAWIALGFGVGALLVGTAAVFGELEDALNRIWRAPLPRPPGLVRLVRERLALFAVIVGCGVLQLVSLLLSVAASALGRSAPVGQGWPLGLEAIEFAASFALTALLFALIYRGVPRVAIAWPDVRIGAAASALLFTTGQALLGFYIGRIAPTSVFAAAGSLLVALLWLYGAAQLFLLGAEFTWLYAHTYGSRRGRARAPPAVALPRRARGPVQEPPILVKPWPFDLARKAPVVRARGART